MIKMAVEKFLYKYQCLEKVKDESGNDRQYTIENLTNNQFYFQHPREYNDPYDSILRYYKESTVEASIDKLINKHGLSRDKAIDIINNNINKGRTKRDGDLLRTECYGRDHLPLPLICCFSENSDNILMWSHYAHHHKGVCLRFKPKLKNGFPYLTINSKEVRLFPMEYDITPPYPIDFHNQNEEQIQLSKLLLTKSLDWKYEDEYRMFLTEEEAKGNLNEFKKDELEGVILGMRTNYIDAKEIYKTIDENYLKKRINVNFYVAEFNLGEYKAPPKKIDINKHLDKLFKKMKLEDEIKDKQRLNKDFSILFVDSQDDYFLQIRKAE